MSDYREYAATIAANYGLNSNIFIAMLEQESGLRQYKNDGSLVVGGAGEIGIGQIKPSTAKDLGIDPYDPYQNIEGAAKYLAQQYARTGDYSAALAAYNQGYAGSQGKGKAAGANYASQVMARVDDSADVSGLKEWAASVYESTGLDYLADYSTGLYESGAADAVGTVAGMGKAAHVGAVKAANTGFFEKIMDGAAPVIVVGIGILFVGFALFSTIKAAPTIIEKIQG